MMRLRGLAWILVVAAPVTAGLFKVWVHHDAVESGYHLSEEETRRQALQRTLQQLQVELAAERTPEQLERTARKLKMVPPAPEQIFGLLGTTDDGR
jgi:cell division protein FtsL